MQTEAPQKRTQTRLAPDVRRRQIIDEATRLIAIAGFNAVSLADIARACGIRKPSVLHYFPTMNDLLSAVLANRDEQDTPDELPDIDLMSTPDAMRDFAREAVIRNLGRRELIRLYVVLGAEAMDPEHPAHEYFVTREARTIADLELGLAWKKRPDLAARELLGFWMGLERLWSLDPSIDFLAVWDNFSERFFTRD